MQQSTPAQIAQAIIATIALLVALRAWFTSDENLHSGYRPVLRPVPLRDRTTNEIVTSGLVLKNIGRGPAIALMMFKEDPAPVHMVGADYIEPLGALTAAGESERAGRLQVVLNPAHWLQANKTYRIVYQDLVGRWHETRLTFTRGRHFTVHYLGPKRFWHAGHAIPQALLKIGEYVNAFEPFDNAPTPNVSTPKQVTQSVGHPGAVAGV